LGIKDVAFFSAPLRHKWLWSEWTDQSKPWVGTALPMTHAGRNFFSASTMITIGNGDSAKFWRSRWLLGQAPEDIAPGIYSLSCMKNITVKYAPQDNKWTTYIKGITSDAQVHEFVNL
jgi:hypothetical protein